MCWQIMYLTYMYKENLALNNLLWVVCHKTQRNQTKSYLIYMYEENLVLTKPQWYYLPTPPLGQDMTQGQFLRGV